MAEWECYLDGLLRVSGSPLPPVVAVLQSRLTYEREQLLRCSVREQREMGLPLSVGQEVCRCEPEGEMVLRWRANYGPTAWHQDGDGEKRTEGWLGLLYLTGSVALSFRRIDNGETCEVMVSAGMIVVFNNSELEHSAGAGERSFFGPMPVSSIQGVAPPVPQRLSRGGDFCCRSGVETCCGNMCDRCRWQAERAAKERARIAAAPLVTRHLFAYTRASHPFVRLELVERLGARLVRFADGPPLPKDVGTSLRAAY